jgi:DNA-binding NarL/FixJ family response regulator
MAAVRAAAEGHAPLDPRVARALLPSGQPARPADELSTREQQVLRLVTKGWPTSRSPDTWASASPP